MEGNDIDDDNDNDDDREDGSDDSYSNEEGVHKLTELLLVVPRRHRRINDSNEGNAAVDKDGGEPSLQSLSSKTPRNASRNDDL